MPTFSAIVHSSVYTVKPILNYCHLTRVNPMKPFTTAMYVCYGFSRLDRCKLHKNATCHPLPSTPIIRYHPLLSTTFTRYHPSLTLPGTTLYRVPSFIDVIRYHPLLTLPGTTLYQISWVLVVESTYQGC